MRKEASGDDGTRQVRFQGEDTIRGALHIYNGDSSDGEVCGAAGVDANVDGAPHPHVSPDQRVGGRDVVPPVPRDGVPDNVVCGGDLRADDGHKSSESSNPDQERCGERVT